MLNIPGLTAATAAAAASSLDISTAALATTAWAISLTITALSCASGGPPRVRIQVEDTVDNFTTPLTIGFFNLSGTITPDTPVTVSIERAQCPSLRAGVTSAKLRFNLVAIEGTTPTVTFAGALL